MWHTNTITHHLLVFLIFMLSQTTANDVNKSLEAKALLAWWPYANASDDHCNRERIACNKARSVIEISLYSDHLVGRPHLGSLDFSSFPNLVSLTFEDCGLEGIIPEQIGLLSNLTHLSLWLNGLKGKIPVSLTNLTHLEYLHLSDNNFNGKLPVSFPNLIRLEYLDLAFNIFNANLPVSFTNLTRLKHLDLSGNNFSGNLSFPFTRLLFLGLSKNQLTGPIPPSCGSMVNLILLDLSKNQPYGSLHQRIDQ